MIARVSTSIRVPADVWKAFGLLCDKTRGGSRAERINVYIKTQVKTKGPRLGINLPESEE